MSPSHVAPNLELHFLLCRKPWKSHPTHCSEGKHCTGQRDTDGGRVERREADCWSTARVYEKRAGKMKLFHKRAGFLRLSGDRAVKIIPTTQIHSLFGCRTLSWGCSCTFPLWRAHRSRKQPDRKRTSVFPSAVGSRVLRQSNLSWWKLKCDLTFCFNLNTIQKHTVLRVQLWKESSLPTTPLPPHNDTNTSLFLSEPIDHPHYALQCFIDLHPSLSKAGGVVAGWDFVTQSLTSDSATYFKTSVPRGAWR